MSKNNSNKYYNITSQKKCGLAKKTNNHDEKNEIKIYSNNINLG